MKVGICPCPGGGPIFKGRAARRAEQKFMKWVWSQYNMSLEQQEMLHDAIHGMNFSHREIMKIAESIVAKKGG
jgi:hypothetical protein